MNDQEAKLFLQQIRNVSKNETQSNTKTCIKTTPAYVISVNGQMATVRLVTDLTGANPFNVPIITSQTISPGDYANLAYWDNLSTAVIFSGGNNYPICPNIPIRPNLLDNACFVGGGTGWGVFPVNQRGQTSYASPSVTPVQTIDRWYIRDGAEIGLLDTGVNVSLQSGGRFAQVIGRDLVAGEVYTVSFLIGNIESGGPINVYVQENGGDYLSPINSLISQNGLFSQTFVCPKTESYLIIFTNSSQSTLAFDLTAVKIELGDTQTLAYQKSDGTWAMLPQNLNYQQELAKCQAYYWEGDNLCFHAYRAAGYNAVIQVPLPGPMRVDSPAVTISGLLISSTGASESITPASTYGATSGILIIESPVSTLDGTFVGNAQVISIAVNAEL